jgi:hypothetical protein
MSGPLRRIRAAVAERLPRGVRPRIVELEGQVRRQRDRLEVQARRTQGHAKRIAALNRTQQALQARVRELEAELQLERRVSKRVAELTELVGMVLVPVANRDDDELRRRLDEYAAQIEALPSRDTL